MKCPALWACAALAFAGAPGAGRAATTAEKAFDLVQHQQWQAAYDLLRPYRESHQGYTAGTVSIDFMLGVSACQLNQRQFGLQTLSAMVGNYPALGTSGRSVLVWHIQNCGTQEQAVEAARAHGKGDEANDYMTLAHPPAVSVRRAVTETAAAPPPAADPAAVWAQRLDMDPDQYRAMVNGSASDRAALANKARLQNLQRADRTKQ